MSKEITAFILKNTSTRAMLSNGSVWPLPCEDMGELEWQLRYGRGELSRSQRLDIAGIVNSYMFMIGNCTQKERNAICKALKVAKGEEDEIQKEASGN